MRGFSAIDRDYCTATEVVARPVFPALSVTVSDTEYVAAAAYVCVGDAAVLVVPSPKFQE
jgi:hypothetical protein